MISAAGCWNRNSCGRQGFSLLEMLIVILILGILYSLAGSMLSLSVSDPLNEEADRLRERILLAQDESLVRSQALALGFSEKGYAFFVQGEQEQWLPFERDRLLGKHDFLGSYEQSVYLQGQAVKLPKTVEVRPQVFILPTGEMLPFEWHLQEKGGRAVVLKFDNAGREIDPFAEEL